MTLEGRVVQVNRLAPTMIWNRSCETATSVEKVPWMPVSKKSSRRPVCMTENSRCSVETSRRRNSVGCVGLDDPLGNVGRGEELISRRNWATAS